MAADFRHQNTRRLASLTLGADDPSTLNALFSACRAELRSVAGKLMQGERVDHTLQPTALINEVYLRLFNVDEVAVDGRTHFVNLAARSMRQILVEHARRHKAIKRGGDRFAVTLSNLADPGFEDGLDLLDLNDALEKLAERDPRAVEVIELRVFGGMTMAEIATIVGVSRRTVQNDWRFALLWLRQEFAGQNAP